MNVIVWRDERDDGGDETHLEAHDGVAVEALGDRLTIVPAQQRGLDEESIGRAVRAVGQKGLCNLRRESEMVGHGEQARSEEVPSTQHVGAAWLELAFGLGRDVVAVGVIAFVVRERAASASSPARLVALGRGRHSERDGREWLENALVDRLQGWLRRDADLEPVAPRNLK